MTLRQILRWAALTMMPLLILSGCSGLSLGPQVRTDYVMIHQGRPLKVLQTVTVTGRVLDGTGDTVQQQVGGWVMMPPDHWDAVKTDLEAYQKAKNAAPTGK